MRLMVVGASKGLGRAFVEGLCTEGDSVIGVSRKRPNDLAMPSSVDLQWIEADLTEPLEAAQHIEQQTAAELDVLIYNLGLWEDSAFTQHYSFLEDADDSIVNMVSANITGTILVLKRLIPKLLKSAKPQLILTGSTSGLRQSGRPEVTFGASKFALTGIGDALREGFRGSGLAVTCLQLGYLNTEDGLAVPLSEASERGGRQLIPVHDVVKLVRALLEMSPSSYVRELVVPSIGDERF